MKVHREASPRIKLLYTSDRLPRRKLLCSATGYKKKSTDQRIMTTESGWTEETMGPLAF